MNLKNLFKNKKIAVWGDIILDEYILTVSKRISREAPVPVTEFESNNFKPGGAGNVIMNLKSLGAEPVPVGILGDDEAADEIISMFRRTDIDVSSLIRSEEYKTPKKSRILSGSINTKKQQILRIDNLFSGEIAEVLSNSIEGELNRIIPECDIVIISDYLKDSVQPRIFSKLKKNFPEKIFVLDSRENITEFCYVDYITPNEPEFKRLFPSTVFRNEEDFLNCGKLLLDRMKCRGIILKRGHKGMIIFEKGKTPLQIPIHGSSSIVDVTGAGDTVISLLSLSLASGLELGLSADIANKGASIVVMKEGAYPLSTEELEEEV